MSKERELLERLLKNFEQPVAGRFGDLFDEVRTYLAEPEVKQEALSLTEKGTQYPYANENEFDWFLRGIRFAEKHHGIIGVENE